MTTADPLTLEISRSIWTTEYRAEGEAGVADSWRRVAQAAERSSAASWAERFFHLQADFRRDAFLANGCKLPYRARGGLNRETQGQEGKASSASLRARPSRLIAASRRAASARLAAAST